MAGCITTVAAIDGWAGRAVAVARVGVETGRAVGADVLVAGAATRVAVGAEVGRAPAVGVGVRGGEVGAAAGAAAG